MAATLRPIKGVHRIYHRKSRQWAWRVQVRWRTKTIARLFVDRAHGGRDATLRRANAASRAAHRTLGKPFGADVRANTRYATAVPGISRSPTGSGWICRARASRYGLNLRARVSDAAGFAAAERRLAALRRELETAIRARGVPDFRLETLRKRPSRNARAVERSPSSLRPATRQTTARAGVADTLPVLPPREDP